MIWYSLFALLGIGAVYFSLFIFIPMAFLNAHLKDRGLADRIIISFVVSSLCITMLVFLLAFLNILHSLTLMAVILLCLTVFVMRSKRTAQGLRDFFQHFNYLPKESGHMRRGRLFSAAKCSAAALLKGVGEGFLRHPVYYLGIAAVFLYGFYFKSYHVLHNLQFGTSDMYVHLEWLKYFQDGRIFYAGIYPFALHNVTLATHLLTGIGLEPLVQYLGVWHGMLILFSLYALLRRVFVSRTPVLLAMLFYCAGSLFRIEAVNSQSFFLPQEYGMIFLYPCVMFFTGYIEGKDKRDLVAFGAAFAAILSAHFYIVISAAALCGICAMPYIIKIFKNRAHLPLIITTAAAAAVGCAPYAIGRILGIAWNSSMVWAQEVMSGMYSTAGAGAEEIPGIIDSMLRLSLVNIPLACFAVIFVFCSITMFWSDHSKKLIGISGYLLILFAIAVIPTYGYMTIMDLTRVMPFIAYALPFIVAAPVDIIGRMLKKWKWSRRIYEGGAILLIIAYAVYLFPLGNRMPLGYSFRMQYSDNVQCFYKIVREFPKDKWTIISNAEEYTMAMGNGFYYQLRNLIDSMEDYDPEKRIEIPTPYVFIFIEKRPLVSADVLRYDEPEQEYPSVSYELANRNLAELEREISNKDAENADYELRRTLESKAYYWAREFLKEFPDTTRIYFETDRLVVYEIRQNMNILHNLNLDYGINAAQDLEMTTEEPAV